MLAVEWDAVQRSLVKRMVQFLMFKYNYKLQVNKL